MLKYFKGISSSLEAMRDCNAPLHFLIFGFPSRFVTFSATADAFTTTILIHQPVARVVAPKRHIDSTMDLGGEEIALMLRSTGPVIKCVILRVDSATVTVSDDDDKKPNAATDEAPCEEAKPVGCAASAVPTKIGSPPHPLVDLIDEIEVDTTPKKAMVSQILGGPFTFLGQYEDEGIMVMVRRPTSDKGSFEVSDDESEEEEEIAAEAEEAPPINPHKLQPPLHNKVVRGDILLMRVAKADEDDEEGGTNDEVRGKASESNGDEKKGDQDEHEQAAHTGQTLERENEKESITPESNDDFFLDYTREEYLKFAARTDIPDHEVDSGEGEEDIEASDEEEGSDEEFGLEDLEGEDDDEQDEEDAQVGMMNLIFGQILRRFREERGRGPDTRELLEMRMALAERLGVDVPPIDEEGSDWDKKAERSPGGRKLGTKPSSPPEYEDEQKEEDSADIDLKDGGLTVADSTSVDQLNGDGVETGKTNQSSTSEIMTTPKRGKKRSSADDDEDSDNLEDSSKKVKFVPKSEHKVHVLERVGDGDNDSSDEDFVEGDSSDDDKAEGNGLVMA